MMAPAFMNGLSDLVIRMSKEELGKRMQALEKGSTVQDSQGHAVGLRKGDDALASLQAVSAAAKAVNGHTAPKTSAVNAASTTARPPSSAPPPKETWAQHQQPQPHGMQPQQPPHGMQPQQQHMRPPNMHPPNMRPPNMLMRPGGMGAQRPMGMQQRPFMMQPRPGQPAWLPQRPPRGAVPGGFPQQNHHMQQRPMAGGQMRFRNGMAPPPPQPPLPVQPPPPMKNSNQWGSSAPQPPNGNMHGQPYPMNNVPVQRAVPVSGVMAMDVSDDDDNGKPSQSSSQNKQKGRKKHKHKQQKQQQFSGSKPTTMPKGGKYEDFAGLDVAVFKRFKEKVADAMRKSLKKFFAKKMISSKSDFKELCRTLTHKIVLKEGKGDTGRAGKFTPSLGKKIGKYVDAYFQKNGAYNSSKK